ncbi:hypothetical protein SB48_HM08orf05139 [Heyndrickxia coagulans]|uniref:Uncharacterized protein n=1 Tax=Heyndrickxia coagulans TaxID=1398 RepID=A0AAN0T8R9_HEYCO|nr:hypothetical protein SB48_HM08orf05139 [Heyndrickxia coagulans]
MKLFGENRRQTDHSFVLIAGVGKWGQPGSNGFGKMAGKGPYG